MNSLEYKIVTTRAGGISCSSTYFRCNPNEDWIFLTEYFGEDSVEKADQYLQRVKNSQ